VTAPALVGQDEEDEEDLIPNGRDDEEVNGDNFLDVVSKEGAPGQGGRLPSPDNALFDRGLDDIDADHAEFANDARSAQEEIGVGLPRFRRQVGYAA
jgi:hypothetical protein